jgi:hypothetical protein
MTATGSRTVTVRLEAVRFTHTSSRLSRLRCIACGSPLTVHQPEEGQPRRLLGTCDGCGRWHLLDCEPGPGRSVMVLLPEAQVLRGPAPA